MAAFQIQLDEPIQIGEETKTQLDFDFDGMTGRDMAKAAKMAQVKGGPDGFNPLSMENRIAVAAVAAGVPYDRILDLPGRKFNKVMLATLAFCAGEEQVSPADLSDNT